MDKPHILILDEPTSHLDIDSREALIYALNDFKGAVLLITHDIFLAEGTADQLWLVKDGKAEVYDGDLQDYRALVLQADRNKSDSKSKSRKSDPVLAAPKVNKADQRQRSSESRKAASGLKRKADDAEKRLDQINARITAIDADLTKPGHASEQLQDLLRQRADLVSESEATERVWLQAVEDYETALDA
jgi:ATP-binding cassette, subfamily F, member 3